jgi:hypothetical protein
MTFHISYEAVKYVAYMNIHYCQTLKTVVNAIDI